MTGSRRTPPRTYPVIGDPGRAHIVESSSVTRAALCWATLVEIREGHAWPRTCIHPVDEHAPVCPDHGARRPPTDTPPDPTTGGPDMPPTTRPGWAEPIPARSITGRRAEVSVTATTVQGDPDEPDGPRWLLRATAFGPQGGRRGDVELVLPPDERDRLLAQLLTQPAADPAAPASTAATALAACRQLIAEVDALTDQINAGDAPDAVHDHRDQLDRDIAAIARELLGGTP